MTTPIVHMDNIEKHFGNIIALSGVTFDVRAGEVLPSPRPSHVFEVGDKVVVLGTA